MLIDSTKAAVLLAAAITLLTASAAAAAPAESDAGEAQAYITADGSPQAGEAIQVVVRCAGAVDAPASPALHIGNLVETPSPDATPAYVAPAIIDPDTPAGDHALTVRCAGAELRSTFTVYPPTTQGELSIAADGSPQAGEAIEVVLRCDGAVGPPTSAALQMGNLVRTPTPDETPVHVAPAIIDPAAAVGEHALTAPCDGGLASATFTVYPR